MITRLRVRTAKGSSAVDITPQVSQAVRSSGIQSGVCHVYVPHTTAGATINEGADASVADDLLDHLDRLVPWDGPYRHAEGNAAAHIKSSLVGHAATILVEGGRLLLGTWQAIFLCEFDGPREREVLVTVVGGDRAT